MTTVRSAREYARLQASRAARMKPLKSKVNYAKSRRMALLARTLAPVYHGSDPRTVPGVLRDNIFTMKSGSGAGAWSVISTFPGPFKANLWANQTAATGGAYDTFAPRMKWNLGLPTVYGTGAAQYSALPGFFERAKVLARLYGARVARQEMNSMLAGEVT